MRLIKKSADGGGYHLDRANEMPPSTSDEATSRWSSFSHKLAMTQLLLNEQYGLCAYSEIRPDEFYLGTHIEHIEPKNLNPSRTFDYSNLVLNALSDEDLNKLEKGYHFGGHSKLSEYDERLFISCLQIECARTFVYLSNGWVEPARTLSEEKTTKSQYTIDLLNLNSPYLVNQRKNWLSELDALIDEHLLDDMSLKQLASIYLIPVNNRLDSFFTANRQRFGNVAERVLVNEAPSLV